jgi:hypothetical protein
MAVNLLRVMTEYNRTRCFKWEWLWTALPYERSIVSHLAKESIMHEHIPVTLLEHDEQDPSEGARWAGAFLAGSSRS